MSATAIHVRTNGDAEAVVAGDMIAQMYMGWLWRIGTLATMTTTRVVDPLSGRVTVSRKIVCQCDLEVGAECGVHRVVRTAQADPARRRCTAMVQVSGRDAALPRDAPVVRHYVLDPYHRVRCARSGLETEDVRKVLAGDIDEMMDAARAATAQEGA